MVGRRVLVALAIGLAGAQWASVLGAAAAAAPPRCPLPAAAARGAGGSCDDVDGDTGEPMADDTGEPVTDETGAPVTDASDPVVEDDPLSAPPPAPHTDPLPALVPVGEAPALGAMVDGGPAADAAAPEASASPAPTPPNGAEPAADRSPATVVAGFVDTDWLTGPTGAATTEQVAPAGTGDTGSGGSDLLDSAVRAVRLPSALGLSPDANRGAPAVALLGFALLLLLVAHQFVERSDPRLDVVRDAEGIVRFR